jgi:hypothetical protein
VSELVFWILWPVAMGIAAAGAMLLGRWIYPPTPVHLEEGAARSIAERTAGTIGRGVIEMMMRDRQLIHEHGLRRDEALASKIDEMGRSIIHIAQAFETLADAFSSSIAAINLRFGTGTRQDQPAKADGTVAPLPAPSAEADAPDASTGPGAIRHA